MNNSDLLTILRCDLQNPPAALNDYLEHLLQTAQEAITSYGITLCSDSIEDKHLVVMYASWLYRKRNSDSGMPRMLQNALHSRLINEKGGVM